MIGIDKRRNKRIDYKVKADVSCDSKHANAMIENFSETGIFKIVFSEKSVIDFYLGKTIRVNFQLPLGTELNLECEIKWVRIQSGSPLLLKYSMGVQIINPPPIYKEFIKSLSQRFEA